MTTTRLTKNIRESIVTCIMADVPKVDYRGQAEKLMRDCIESQLPDEVKAFLKTEYSDRIAVSYYYGDFHGKAICIAIRGANSYSEKITNAVKEKIEVLSKMDRDEEIARRALKDKVEATLMAFTTVEQVRKSCPEFDKYLPSSVQPIKNLPSVTNTVADLMSAGWPKK